MYKVMFQFRGQKPDTVSEFDGTPMKFTTRQDAQGFILALLKMSRERKQTPPDYYITEL